MTTKWELEVESNLRWGVGMLILGVLTIFDPLGGLADWGFAPNVTSACGVLMILASGLFFKVHSDGKAELGTCTGCKNVVHKDATVCQHCGSKFN
jgi:hypothetical protein